MVYKMSCYWQLFPMHNLCEDQFKSITYKVRTLWESEDLLAGPHFVTPPLIDFLGVKTWF